jgi:HemY protein
MIRIVVFLLVIAAVAAGLHWLADRPGTILIEWQGYILETSVFLAVVLSAVLIAALLLVWSALKHIWDGPAALRRFLGRRREKRGLDALSGGIIAIGAGDGHLATRYALQARRSLPNEPLTHLLRAQAAQLNGDRATARRIYEAMLASPDTEQLGLRGLFLEAKREGEGEPARQFAERALNLNPKLAWPVEALFDLMCKAQDWQGALDILEIARRQSLMDKAVVSRRRAVLLTAKALDAEESDADKALEFAAEAHRLAPDLVPAATVAGRILASRGNTPRAARVLLKTWRVAPHPELATVYAYARPGDSPRDRLVRVRHLGRLTPDDSEAAIAIAIAAIEAREWEEARRVLEPLLEARLTQRVCTLMARIEGEEHGHAGRVREWLARAVNAPRDPAWTADGVVSDHWAATSPVTGVLDAYRWRVPVEAIDAAGGALLAAKVEALVGLGAASEGRFETRTQAAVAPGAARILEAGEGSDRAAAPAVAQPAPAKAAPETRPSALEPRTEQVPSKAARSREDPEGADRQARPVPSSAPGQKARPSVKRTQAPAEPRIYVPPHAPDDPGTEPVEDQSLPLPYLRGSPAKA